MEPSEPGEGIEQAVPAERPGRVISIEARGKLWTSPIEGMTVENRGDVTIITGKIIDQSHLQAVLDQLMNQGVELISVNPGPRSTANG
jgi:uncharacterized protein YlxW (UPF0749 family)